MCHLDHCHSRRFPKRNHAKRNLFLVRDRPIRFVSPSFHIQSNRSFTITNSHSLLCCSVQRDDGAYGIIADDEHDDQDVGEDHLAVCRLICALSQEAPQRAQIGETDLPKAFMKFARHPNRIFSSPALLHEIQKVKRRFDVAV